ncbi:MAG: hypothetical protein JW963_04450, partial [Anaerolineales bacterium]|nr:hypothetical protein [Anaerolineales bacterium]
MSAKDSLITNICPIFHRTLYFRGAFFIGAQIYTNIKDSFRSATTECGDHGSRVVSERIQLN